MAAETNRNKTIVSAFVEAINNRDWDALDALVAEDFVRHSASAPPVRNRDELKQFLHREFETFPDAMESIDDMVAENDRVAVRHRFRGTQTGQMGPWPPSSRILAADYLAIYRIANGVIAESWAEWDNLSGLRQLGHFTSTT
ncbi:MAG: ester cyclase [Burkholderiales bacterium]